METKNIELFLEEMEALQKGETIALYCDEEKGIEINISFPIK